MSWFYKKKGDNSKEFEDNSVSLQEIPRPSIKDQIEMPHSDLTPLPELESMEPIKPMEPLNSMQTTPMPSFENSSMPVVPPMSPGVREEEPVHEQVAPGQNFVEHSAYEDVMKSVSATETAIAQSEAIMQQLTLLRSEADTILEDWRTSLEDAERKLLYADKVLFEK